MGSCKGMRILKNPDLMVFQNIVTAQKFNLKIFMEIDYKCQLYCLKNTKIKDVSIYVYTFIEFITVFLGFVSCAVNNLTFLV